MFLTIAFIHIDHLNHIKDRIGADYIGLGADYDGVDRQPEGLNDVSMYPHLFDLLAEEGHGYEPWTPDELKKLAGLNLIRVFKDVERVASEMKAHGVKPLEDIIPDVDLLEAGDQSCRTDISGAPNLRKYQYNTRDSDGGAC